MKYAVVTGRGDMGNFEDENRYGNLGREVYAVDLSSMLACMLLPEYR